MYKQSSGVSLSQSILTSLSHFLSHGTLCMVKYDLLSSLRATTGTSPALRTRWWEMGNCQERSCSEVRGQGKSKLTSLDFAKNESFLARFTRCLRTSRLLIFKGKHRNLSESHDWRGITHQILSLYLKVCLKFSSEYACDIFIDLYCCTNINPEKEIFICALCKFLKNLLIIHIREKKATFLVHNLFLKILKTMTNYSLKSYLQILFFLIKKNI